MDLRFLKTFQTIVQTGSFQQAAEQLLYAQSTVTVQIQKLESELGVQLFDRNGKRVTLTEAGRILYEQSKQIMKDIEALQQSITDIGTGYSGHIRLGAIEPTASLRLPELIHSFCQERPHVNVTLEVGTAPPLHQRILADQLDFVISTPPAPSSGLVFEPLFTEPFSLLIPSDHALATQEAIEPADLSHYRLILSEPTCAYKEMIEQIMLENNFTLQSGLEIGSIEGMKRLVQAGAGIALIPTVAADHLPAGTAMKQIRTIGFQVRLGLVYRPESHRFGLALKSFLALCRNRLRS